MNLLIRCDRRLMFLILITPFILDRIFNLSTDFFNFIFFLPIGLWQFSAGKILFERAKNCSKGLFLLFQISIIFIGVYSLIPLLNLDIPLLLFGFSWIVALLSYLWCMNYITDLLQKMESTQGKNIDGLITFGLIFFLPLGIWWLQPRMQSIINKPLQVEK